MYHELKPKIIKCAVCETEFDARKRNRGKGTQKYCGPKCRQMADNRRHYRRRNPLKTEAELTRKCVICQTIFVTDAHHAEALTCSVKCNEARMNAKCRLAAIRKQTETVKECEECGKSYTPHRRAVKRAKYCSRRCAIRSAARAFRERQGSRAGASTKRLGSPEWLRARELALERDGHKCKICGATNGKLHVHHLFHRTEAERQDHAPEGLLTLCGSCHRKMHEIRFGKNGDEFVISGFVFDWLGIDKVRIERNNNGEPRFQRSRQQSWQQTPEVQAQGRGASGQGQRAHG